VSLTRAIHGLVITDHEFSLPLDHDNPAGETIGVFAREVAAEDGRDKPYLVFFQGGPGSEAPRPTTRDDPPWLPRALEDYRVLFLDQRGTGRSTPVGALPGMTPQEQYAYLLNFRADSIVRDAEAVRQELGVEKWSVLGQSFGGFCVTAYLSFYGGSLTEAYVTGGLPAVGRPVDGVYDTTYALMRERNRRFYERYPEDRDTVREIVARLDSEDVRLPSNDRLTARRFRQLGHAFGMSDGFERVHYLLDFPFGSPAFLHGVEEVTVFGRNPIYAVLHEACWADGGATRWSAERVMPDDFRSTPELLTGEMIFPWMFDDEAALSPLREAAGLLAEHEWGRLYDDDALERNEVPAAAVIYADDPYVPRVLSEETAARIARLRPWLTNEYLHDGLRQDTRVLARLIDLARGRV